MISKPKPDRGKAPAAQSLSSRSQPIWRLLLRGLTLAFIAILTVQSLVPSSGTQTIAHLDKFVHLIIYAILAGLIGISWPRLRAFMTFALAALYGGVMEIAQGAMGLGRAATWGDFAANCVGAALAVIILYAVIRRRR